MRRLLKHGPTLPVDWKPRSEEVVLAKRLGLIHGDTGSCFDSSMDRIKAKNGWRNYPYCYGMTQLELPIALIIQDLVMYNLPFEPAFARVAAACIWERREKADYGIRIWLARHRLFVIFDICWLATTRLRAPQNLWDWELLPEAESKGIRNLKTWDREMRIHLEYLRSDRAILKELIMKWNCKPQNHGEVPYIDMVRHIIAAPSDQPDLLVSCEGLAWFVPA